MRGIKLFGSVLCAIGLLLTPFSTHAEILFKRIKCTDAVTPQGNGLMFFNNQASFSKYIAVQIVRDGCSPKGGAGSFSVWNTDFYDTVTLGSGSSVTRMGNKTTAVFREISGGSVARIRFFTVNNVKARGTFDLLLEID